MRSAASANGGGHHRLRVSPKNQLKISLRGDV
jgi:hypothetical protein